MHARRRVVAAILMALVSVSAALAGCSKSTSPAPAGPPIQAQSAVGVMLQFATAHPDFGAAGSFYVNFTPVPFRERNNWREKLKCLRDNGYEVASHTMYRAEQSKLSDDEVRRNLGEEVKLIREVLPDYDGSTFALPFGIWPQHKEQAIRGEWEGVAYNHRAVLLVGSGIPTPSPCPKRMRNA